MERFRSFEGEPPESLSPKKITRRKMIKAIAGGIAGAAFLGKEKAEGAEIARPESREREPSNVLKFPQLVEGVERYFRERTTIDDAAKEKAERDIDALREQFGDDAVRFVQELVMEKYVAQDATPEEKRRIEQQFDFVTKVFGNKDLETHFRSKLARNLEELKRSPGSNRGYVTANIPIGNKDVDTLIAFSFGRPAESTVGAQADVTARGGAELDSADMWQKEIATQFPRRWTRINTVPPSNDFQFSVPVRSGLPGWEKESLFLIGAYGRTKK